MNFSESNVIPETHPSLAGHFPGNPVVPGVVILESVQNAIENWQGKVRLQSMPAVKFLNPLFPGHEYTINLEMTENNINTINFTCTEQNNIIAQGSVSFFRNN